MTLHHPNSRFAPGWQWILVALLLFAARILGWMRADLWYDEIITLGDFVIGPARANNIGHVFRSYPVANNHVLFSAVAWCWFRFLPMHTEALLRIPSAVFGGLTIVCIVRLWQPWLGTRRAGLAGLVFAFSPVFGAFAYQFRGYALTMLLATLCAAGVVEMVEGSYRRGLLLHVPAAALLPLVIPTNALLVAAHLLYLLWTSHGNVPLRTRITRVLPVAGALLVGCSFYLTIWPEFIAAAKQTAGWPRASLVAGALVVGGMAHLGPMVLGCALRMGAALPRRRGIVRQMNPELREAAKLCACCIAAIIVPLLVFRSAPFPRVFLMFLPTFSFAVMRTTRNVSFWDNRAILVGGLIIMHGFLWEQLSTTLAHRQILAGKYPQNLLQQYYRGSNDMSMLCGRIARYDRGQTVVVLTNAYDFPAVRYYWRLNGLPLGQVLVADSEGEQRWQRHFAPAGFTLAAVAPNEIEAAHLFNNVGQTGAFSLRHRTRLRSLFILGLPVSPDAYFPPSLPR